MHPDLAKAICLFRHDQELALDYIHSKLGVPVPATAIDWATSVGKQVAAAHSISARDGVTLDVHGYGIDVKHPEFWVDFDYGPKGECDCFDVWRLSLHRHYRLRLPDAVDDPRPLEEWLNEAVDAGELNRVTDSYSMFYDPSIPSKWTHAIRNLR